MRKISGCHEWPSHCSGRLHLRRRFYPELVQHGQRHVSDDQPASWTRRAHPQHRPSLRHPGVAPAAERGTVITPPWICALNRDRHHRGAAATPHRNLATGLVEDTTSLSVGDACKKNRVCVPIAVVNCCQVWPSLGPKCMAHALGRSSWSNCVKGAGHWLWSEGSVSMAMGAKPDLALTCDAEEGKRTCEWDDALIDLMDITFVSILGSLSKNKPH